MKTLLLTPSVALGVGLAGTAIAETPTMDVETPTPSIEIISHQKVSLDETSEFYQGDFLVSARAKLKGLAQENLYTGLGATELPSNRFVT